ncbi:MAG: DUF885 domain-containing protein [Thermoflexales bacterium]|nr:DUF885 domain-containing protein [Thermoflexales bacterium]
MSSSAANELRNLTDAYLRAYCETYPHAAVWLGFHEYDGRLPDLSRRGLEARLSDLRRFLADLERIDPADLDERAWLDYQVVRHEALFEAFALAEWRKLERDPIPYLETLNVGNYILRNYAPLEVRARALLAHLRGIPAVLSAMRENLTRPMRPAVGVAARLGKGLASFLQDDLPGALMGLEDGALRAELDGATRDAVREVEAAVSWLENDLAPRAADDFALGAETFARMLALSEGVDMPLEQLREVAEENLARDKAAFLETAARLGGPGRDPLDVVAEGKRRHPSPEALVSEVRRLVDDLRQTVVARGIVSVPYDENCIVAETPPFLRYAFAMMYDVGPFEPVAREAYYYVTPPEPDWPPEKVEEWMTAFTYHSLWSTCVHEAWPGHYLHGLHTRNAPSAVTKAFSSYAFTEGWAHYCEQMMWETVCPDDLWARLGQLSEALLRDVRFACALGLHTAGMTVEEATRRFVEDAFMEPAPAEEEAVRGTYDPQYLNYTLGKLMVLRLREDVRARQGDGFDLRAFHDRFLSYGTPPIPVVRRLMLGTDKGDVV